MNILPGRNRCPCLTHDVGLGLCTGFVIYPILMAVNINFETYGLNENLTNQAVNWMKNQS